MFFNAMPNELLTNLCKKLTDNNLEYEIVNSPVQNNSEAVKFQIPCGREKHECIANEQDSFLEKMISCNFEKYKFIKGYEAIWSSDLKKIECEIYQSGYSYLNLPGSITLREISHYTPESNHKTYLKKIARGQVLISEVKSIELQPIGNIKISIGYSSDEFAILSACRQYKDNIDGYKVTLKLSDVEVKTHDEAYKLIVKISNSLFFQLDLIANLPINLVSQRENRIQQLDRIKRKTINKVDKNLETPKYEYNPEPMSFYWHAKNLVGMPLFQFLAYYQTIEFYFPFCSDHDAKKKLQNLIKDPRFNPDNDVDIAKLLNSVKMFGCKTIGDEREQLEVTIKYCVTNEGLRKFFELMSDRKSFYTNNKFSLSQCKISIQNKKADLIKEVAIRLYDIRCLIVHTKSDHELINPLSPEVKKIRYDLELIEYIARQILISMSSSLKIN